MKTTYRYSVIVNRGSDRITLDTDDVSTAIHEFLRAHSCDCDACICDGTTGEVLCHNGEEPYATDEMALMVAGYVAICEDEDEEPEEVVEIPGLGVVSKFLAEVMALPAEGLPS